MIADASTPLRYTKQGSPAAGRCARTVGEVKLAGGEEEQTEQELTSLFASLPSPVPLMCPGIEEGTRFRQTVCKRDKDLAWLRCSPQLFI